MFSSVVISGGGEAIHVDKSHCYGGQPPLDVGFVIDRSGSMQGSRLFAAKEGATAFARDLRSSDKSGLVSYATGATLDQPLSFNHLATENAISALQAGGGTNTADGITKSHQDFLMNGRSSPVRPVMILLSDGASSDSNAAINAANAAKADGIEIYAIGVGTGVNEAELKLIASDPQTHYFNPETSEETVEVFKDLRDLLIRTDYHSPTIVVERPVPGHLYVDGVDQGPGTSHSSNVATIIGQLTFRAKADDDCWIDNGSISVVAPGWLWQHVFGNETDITTPPFDCNSAEVGRIYQVISMVEDWVGKLGLHHPWIPIECVQAGGQASALGLWAGAKHPESVEYQTTGLDFREDGSGTNRHATVHVNERGLLEIRGNGLEETARLSTGSVITASASTEIQELAIGSPTGLAHSIIQLEGLHVDATVSYDLVSRTASWQDNWRIARLNVLGEEVQVEPQEVAGEDGVDIPLPTGGFLRLFQREVVQTPVGILYRAKLAHVYAEDGVADTVGDGQGRAEVIVGSITLQAGLGISAVSEDRALLLQDDAATGADAGDTLEGSTPLAPPQAFHGSLPAGDPADVYQVPLNTGERLTFTFDSAARATGRGGGAELNVQRDGPTLTPQDPETTTDPLPTYRIDLYDPAKNLRESSTLLSGAGPQSVEFNADATGPWYLRVQRVSGPAGAANYTAGVAVTPVVLLLQNDALSGTDAPDACGPDPAIPHVDTGAWAGVLTAGDSADVFRFDAAAGDTVVAALKPGETADGVDMALKLLGPSCNLITQSNSNLAGFKGTPEAATFTATGPGPYHLVVERLDGVGNYVFTLARG